MMSIVSKISYIRHLLAAGLLLSVLCACSFYDYGFYNDTNPDPSKPQIATGNQYINLSIVVSSGKEDMTRATPDGGEDGDGREVGYEWENAVDGITFMLYAEGEDTLSFFKYYPVDLESRINPGIQYDPNNPSEKNYEAIYTTGNQPLEGLDLSKTYHAVVVANLDLTSADGFKNSTGPIKVQDVLDHTVPRIHDGSNIGATATKMVMSQESDYLVKFDKPLETSNTNGVTLTYTFDGIRIERLAARVDFWTLGSNGYNATLHGYEYPIYKNGTESTPTSGDKFVLTAITPFNCYSNNEYVLKRLGDATGGSLQYLADEPSDYSTTTIYVLDPYTVEKTKAKIGEVSSFMAYELDKIIEDESQWQWDKNPKITIESIKTPNNQWGNTLRTSEDGKGPDTIIVCYPKENTLLKESPLYYYATGLRIEGDYYEEGWDKETGTPNPKVKHLTYYGFLRHQGESTIGSTYEIYSKEDLDEKKDELMGKHPMNFGVVRNNIYRISIDRITEKREVTWQIKVKKWDEFNHDIIYM